MKKLALAICLLVVSIAAQAQFEKGKMILNPSVTGLDFSYSKNDKAKFGIGAQAGTFLADGIALMVNVGADWSKPLLPFPHRNHRTRRILQMALQR